MKTKISIGDHIVFGIPYFESYLKHQGEVLEQKNERVVVKYSAEIETHNGIETITHTTEIPQSFVLNKEFEIT